MPLNAHHELAKAIVTRWKATAAATGLDSVAGPYRNQAPARDSRSLPFCVFGAYLDRDDLIQTTSDSEVREHSFDFRIYADSPETCGAKAAMFRAFLNLFATPGTTLPIPAGLACQKIRPSSDRYSVAAARGEFFVEIVVDFTVSQARS